MAVEEKWSNLFANKETELHLTIQSQAGFNGSIAWSFAVGRATLARKEAAVAVQAGRSTKTAIRLPIPEVRDGVALEARLIATVTATGQNQPAARFEKKYWIFPADPFADRQAWAKGLSVTLLDPAGKTGEVLKKAGVPFEEIRDAEAGRRKGILLIGEGVSFREERGLAESLIKAAAAGATVICLAPQDGAFPLPGAGKLNGLQPSMLSLDRGGAISRIDKRLDLDLWSGNVSAISSGFRLVGEGESVQADVNPGGEGWAWLDVRYPNRGRLVVCGFGVMRHWEASPTPRFLLMRLLESVIEKN